MKISNYFFFFASTSVKAYNATLDSGLLERGLTTDDEKILHDDPIARLDQLVRFSDGLVDDWFGFLKSQRKWKTKLDNNALRMKDAYER